MPRYSIYCRNFIGPENNIYLSCLQAGDVIYTDVDRQGGGIVEFANKADQVNSIHLTRAIIIFSF